MSYFRDSFAPYEDNLMVLPSRFGNKRFWVESELSEKTERRTKKMSITEFNRYPWGVEGQSYEIVQVCNDNMPETKSTSYSRAILEQSQTVFCEFAMEFEPTHLSYAKRLPIGSSLKLNSELSSSQILSKVTFKSDMEGKDGLSLYLGSSSKVYSNIKSGQLSRQSTFESTASSKLYLSEAETYSLSDNLSVKVEPEFLPSSQPYRRPTFRSSIDSVISLLSTKPQSKKGEEIDTRLSLGSSQSSSKAAFDTHASLGLDIHASQGCMSGISILETPMKHTFEQKNGLRQQARSARAITDAAQKEVTAQTRMENLRSKRLLKEQLKRNKLSSTRAEDLLSQWLRMGRFSVQSAETREFREKRTRESSRARKQIKENTTKRSFGRESEWSENSWIRYLSSSSSGNEISTSGSWRSKNLLGLITSQEVWSGIQKGEIRSVPSSTGLKQKGKVKELEHSPQCYRTKLQQHMWCPGEIELSLSLQMPSTSSQVAKNPNTIAVASFHRE